MFEHQHRQHDVKRVREIKRQWLKPIFCHKNSYKARFTLSILLHGLRWLGLDKPRHLAVLRSVRPAAPNPCYSRLLAPQLANGASFDRRGN